ncbi:hypothetical protein C0J52_18212 [Blattella germanica]|nr:hypothetical protein C0J52_18212 [Blattella germanica]
MTAASFLAVVVLTTATLCAGQRITTIQLDGVQYFISRMNPYSPELNYFLAYQYCRSIGLQLASFESKEKADSITQYLLNAGYNGHDYWTSGNRLGADMLIWMSSGVTFNATFDYMRKVPYNEVDSNTSNLPEDTTETTSAKPIPTATARAGRRRKSRDGSMKTGCVSLKAPNLDWDTDDCDIDKDFICEQTRCYYYNYGSIPVSTSQGNNYVRTSTKQTESTTVEPTTTAKLTTTPLGPLLNFTVNRHITLRPPVSRILEKEPDNNVVYVTAVGATNENYANQDHEMTTLKWNEEEEHGSTMQ